MEDISSRMLRFCKIYRMFAKKLGKYHPKIQTTQL